MNAAARIAEVRSWSDVGIHDAMAGRLRSHHTCGTRISVSRKQCIVPRGLLQRSLRCDTEDHYRQVTSAERRRTCRQW